MTTHLPLRKGKPAADMDLVEAAGGKGLNRKQTDQK